MWIVQLALLTLEVTAIILGGLVLTRRPAREHDRSAIADPRRTRAADGLRIVDIMTLQSALLRHRAATHRYPQSLDDLLPAYAPVGRDGLLLTRLPVDPVTRQPYAYSPRADGSDYEIAATLSNGRLFTGFAHNRGSGISDSYPTRL